MIEPVLVIQNPIHYYPRKIRDSTTLITLSLYLSKPLEKVLYTFTFSCHYKEMIYTVARKWAIGFYSELSATRGCDYRFACLTLQQIGSRL